MKRLFITLSVVFALFAVNSFANDVKVSNAVLQAFKSRFSDAENVNWSQVNNFTVAEFTLDEKKHFAYYNAAGELAVVAEPLTMKQLSKAQQANLLKNFQDYAITEIYRLDDNEDIKYYAVVENSTQKLILNTSATKWNIVKTTQK